MPDEFENKTREEIYNELNEQIIKLKHQLEIHQKALFGQKSERFIPDVPDGQLSIFEQTKQELEEEQQKNDPLVSKLLPMNGRLAKPRKKGDRPYLLNSLVWILF